ncbi:hypothetical protein [Enterovibrio norvegicus]|uniref:hypothetical protein n=1 Tax=Enterovibrio norvegicus TaxID=188144 RepID=UPI00352CD962
MTTTSPPENPTTVSIYAHGYKVYGLKAAMEIKLTERLRDDKSPVRDRFGKPDLFRTAIFEAASCSGRHYNWKAKKTFSLTELELPLAIAVLLGFYRKVCFSNHGDKYLVLEYQKTGVLMKLGEVGKDYCLVPLQWPNAIYAGNLLLSQYASNFGLDSSTALEGIKSMCLHYRRSGILSMEDKIPTLSKH